MIIFKEGRANRLLNICKLSYTSIYKNVSIMHIYWGKGAGAWEEHKLVAEA